MLTAAATVAGAVAVVVAATLWGSMENLPKKSKHRKLKIAKTKC